MLAKRCNSFQTSFIRNILTLAQSPGMISFAGGLPNAGLFPTNDIAKASETVLTNQSTRALQYSDSQGAIELRQWICKRYKSHGLEMDEDDVFITSGSQQALDIIARIIINPDDTVLMENPGYLGASQCFNTYSAQLSGLDLDDEGVIPKALSAYDGKAAAFYCVPNFQNPTGMSYSQKRIDELSGLIDEKAHWVIEDNPYGDICFEGKQVFIQPKLKDKTFLLGSFSKVLAPGLRLGWVVVPKEAKAAFLQVKQACDLHSSTVNQLLLAQLLSDFDFDNHIAKLVDFYKGQQQTMLTELTAQLSDYVNVKPSTGGMFLWLELKQEQDMDLLLERCIEKKVLFVPGKYFALNDENQSSIRLSYSDSSKAQIIEGVTNLANCIKQGLS